MPDIMILAKDYQPKHHWPVQVTEKLDGVASIFTVANPLFVSATSRQGEPFFSVPHILSALVNLINGALPTGTQIIGELTVDGVANFKDASGIIRRKVADERIVLNVYDFVRPAGGAQYDYQGRLHDFLKSFGHKLSLISSPVRLIGGGNANTSDEVLTLIKVVFQQNPNAEGVMIRPLHGADSYYRVGRSKGFMRLKAKPTVDLKVISFEEARSVDDVGLGMVGRINCAYGDVPIGVGPGKLTHTERREIWERAECYVGKICQVQYMKDDSYVMLRQPTFQVWRPDKTEGEAPIEAS